MARPAVIRAAYLLESRDLERAASALAVGQSIGNPDLRTPYDEPLMKTHMAKWSLEGNRCVIEFPARNFGKDGLNHLMAVLMGGQCDIDLIKSCRLMSIELAGYMKRRFPGPRYGIQGIRTLTQVEGRPLLGGIIKPKIGCTPDQLAEICVEMALGGVDFIKEDEVLGDVHVSPFKKRITTIATALAKVEYQGLYAPCVTGDGSEAWAKARIAAKCGATAIHLNVWSGMGTYLDVYKHQQLPMFFQKSGDKVWTTGPFSISPPVLYQLANLAGCDFAHVGMYGGYLAERYDQLHERILAMKTTIPSFSCGMTPQLVEQIVKLFGIDLMISSGGYIHSHPRGIQAAVREFRDAIDGAAETYQYDQRLVDRRLRTISATHQPV